MLLVHCTSIPLCSYPPHFQVFYCFQSYFNLGSFTPGTLQLQKLDTCSLPLSGLSSYIFYRVDSLSFPSNYLKVNISAVLLTVILTHCPFLLYICRQHFIGIAVCSIFFLSFINSVIMVQVGLGYHRKCYLQLYNFTSVNSFLTVLESKSYKSRHWKETKKVSEISLGLLVAAILCMISWEGRENKLLWVFFNMPLIQS